MQKMQADVEKPGLELRERVEARLLRPPIETPTPIIHQLPQVFEIGPVGPCRPWGLIREAGARQALAQVGDRRLGNLQRRCRDLVGHRALPGWIRALSWDR